MSEGLLYIAMRYVDGPGPEGAAAREGDARACAGSCVSRGAGGERARRRPRARPDPPRREAGEHPSRDRAGGGDHAYLADFGLTKNVDSHSGLTETGEFVGTIDYMAPEQIEGREVDASADVYALGCVLYECLAGCPVHARDRGRRPLGAHARGPTGPQRGAPRTRDRRR